VRAAVLCGFEGLCWQEVSFDIYITILACGTVLNFWRSMAYHEMRLIIAKVLYHFDIELCPESDDWDDQNTYILWEKKPLICKLKAVD
jgi:hypothetical protein